VHWQHIYQFFLINQLFLEKKKLQWSIFQIIDDFVFKIVLLLCILDYAEYYIQNFI